MASSSAGTFFARTFEQQCREAVAQKLASTSPMKKMVAGITTVADAQAKGFAPSDTQITAMASCIETVASAAYALPAFCSQDSELAATQLIQAIEPQVTQLNEQWKNTRQFYFLSTDLADMLQEAHNLVARTHNQQLSA